jgi:hypothetical protein
MDQAIKKKWPSVALGILTVIITVLTFAVMFYNAFPRVGDTGVVRGVVSMYDRVLDEYPVFLVYDRESYDELRDAILAGDAYGLRELTEHLKAFEVASGTKVLVIDSAFRLRKVRILESPHILDQWSIGLAGWIPMEWIVTQ